jgi:hypothetical protein
VLAWTWRGDALLVIAGTKGYFRDSFCLHQQKLTALSNITPRLRNFSGILKDHELAIAKYQ